MCFRLSLYVLYGSTECVCVSGCRCMVVQSVCVFQGCLCMCCMVVQSVCVCFRLSLYVLYGSTECVCVSGCLCMCCMVVQSVCVFQVVSVCAVW